METIDGVGVEILREFGKTVLWIEEKVVDDSIDWVLSILECHEKAKELIDGEAN